MSTQLKRALAVGTTALLAFVGLLTVPAHSAPTSAPTACPGVWVVVQNDETKPSSTTVGCATTYTNGIVALQSAGYAATVVGSSFGDYVSQVDGLPTDASFATNGGYYWSYWTAAVNADGTLGAWAYSSGGASSSTPSKDKAEGWRLTSVGSDGPVLTRLFTPAASSSAPSNSSPSSASSSSSASSPSTSSQSSSAPLAADVLAAASYLNANLPSEDDGAGAFIYSSLGLASTKSCTYAGTLRSLVASLKTQAADYINGNPGRAANLAILASAVGDNPRSFAGIDLISQIAAGTTSSGQVGAYASSFSQALAVIAYVRAGVTVPANVLQTLVASQDASGAFGYVYGSPAVFSSDYDTTGLAILALKAAGGNAAAVGSAVAWALSEQNAQGYWPNPYSPVDSTGILGSALEYAGTSSGGAAAWIRTQQLADGGFAATLGGTTSNVMATYDALWLLTGTNLVTVSIPLSSCTTAVATPTIATSGGAVSSLADTGAGDLDTPLLPLGVAMLVIGAGILVLRRERQSL